jgi:hypothetical protein
MKMSLWGIYFRDAFNPNRELVRIANTTQYIIPPKVWFTRLEDAEKVAQNFMINTIKPSGLIEKRNNQEYYMRWL